MRRLAQPPVHALRDRVAAAAAEQLEAAADRPILINSLG
jgi:hypothetical protein